MFCRGRRAEVLFKKSKVAYLIIFFDETFAITPTQQRRRLASPICDKGRVGAGAAPESAVGRA